MRQDGRVLLALGIAGTTGVAQADLPEGCQDLMERYATALAALGDCRAAAEIDREVTAALENLYASSPVARVLGAEAKGILVFPRIVKAGFMFGGQYGDGALREHGRTVGYYNSAAVSYGLQAGIESFSYALFFMTEGALEYLQKSEGWEIGAGPTVVVLDQGVAESLTSTTLTQEVYALIFGQQGLMAGIGLQGSKITRINP